MAAPVIPRAGAPNLPKAVVKEGVEQHGRSEHLHAQSRIFRAALHAGIHAADGIEDVGDAHDPKVRRAHLHQGAVVRHQGEYLGGEEEQHRRHQDGDSQSCVHGKAHAAVDGVQVLLAPVLAHQDGEAAHEAEDDDLDEVDGGVGGGDGGEFVAAKQPHHEGVHKTQGRGNEVLGDQRKRQTEQPAVKAGLPAEIVKHGAHPL